MNYLRNFSQLKNKLRKKTKNHMLMNNWVRRSIDLIIIKKYSERKIGLKEGIPNKTMSRWNSISLVSIFPNKIPLNIISAFKKTNIFPLNRKKFTDYFLTSFITDRLFQSFVQQNTNTPNASLTSSSFPVEIIMNVKSTKVRLYISESSTYIF